MKRLGFYLSGSHPVERVIPLIVAAAAKLGQRVLIVAEDKDLLDGIDRALWEEKPLEFLAHGKASEAQAERQPVLLSDTCEAANSAQIIALADGQWRADAEQFERALLFFDDRGREQAREAWRAFDDRDDVEREFHELIDGKWTRKA